MTAKRAAIAASYRNDESPEWAVRDESWVLRGNEWQGVTRDRSSFLVSEILV